MKKISASLLMLAFLIPTASWAKKRAVPAPTPTPTETSTDTPTATPTPIPFTGPKIYTFDAVFGSKGSDPDQLNDPEDIDISEDGKMVIADTGNNRVLVWDANGKPLHAYGSFGTSATWRNAPQFNHPCGLYVHPSKQIFVADTQNHRVVVLDEKGLVVSSWGSQGQDKMQFNLPRAIAKDHSGNIWVLDSGNSRIEIFSGLGAYISTWGSYGTIPGYLNLPLDFTLNFIDQSVLADTGNFRLQVFNDKGAPVTAAGWYGEGPYQFREPAGVVITKTGMVAMVDGPTGRVEFFNNRFEFISQWKAKDEILTPNYSPKFRGIAHDSQDRLYVTDIQNNSIIRLRLVKNPDTPTPPTKTPTPIDNNPFSGNGFPIR